MGSVRERDGYMWLLGEYRRKYGRHPRPTTRVLIEKLVNNLDECEISLHLRNRHHRDFIKYLHEAGILNFRKGYLDLKSGRYRRPSVKFLRADIPQIMVSRERVYYKQKERKSMVNEFKKLLSKGLKHYHFSWAKSVITKIELITSLGKENVNGRIYLQPFTNAEKEFRKTIKLNDQETVEIDFESLHPRLLYQSQGLEVPNDCYNGIYPREVGKKIFLISVNATNKHKAIQALRRDGVVKKELYKAFPDSKKHGEILNAWIDEMIMRHHPIAKFFFTGVSRKLMFIDSCICLKVCNRYMRKTGRPIISIHDSFIVIKQDEELITKIMKEELEKADLSILQKTDIDNVIPLRPKIGVLQGDISA